MRSRTLEGEPGYEVLWALRPDAGGPDVVVDRGWVAAVGRGRERAARRWARPGGRREVVGWVRRGEASRDRRCRPGQIASLNVPSAEGALGLAAVLPGYVLLQSEALADGASPPRPQPLGEPDRSLGPHQAYAYQWWLTWPSASCSCRSASAARCAPRTPRGTRAKPRKTRIWDEEDE